MKEELSGVIGLLVICAIEFALGASYGKERGWSKGYQEGKNVGRLNGIIEALKMKPDTNDLNDEDLLD